MSKLLKDVLLILTVFTLSIVLLNRSIADEARNGIVSAGCSDWKPYCYKEDGRLHGALVDISKAVLDAANVEYTFDVYPWIRVYHKGLNEADFLILGLGRTQKREALFKWIAPLKNPAKIHAYQRADSNISLVNTDDLTDYVIAVERGSYTYDYLVERGHDVEKIVTVSRYDQIFKMMLDNRVQLFLLDDSAFKPEAKRSGFDPKLFQRSILVFKVTEYLATSKKTSDEMVEKLKASYAKLIEQGKINISD